MLIEKVTEMIITATSRKSEMVSYVVDCTHLLFVMNDIENFNRTFVYR
jgi:hypothetical protein